MSAGRRVLVSTDRPRALSGHRPEHASDLAGPHGEVVLASVLVVPHSQPLTAALDRSFTSAREMLDEAERATAMPAGSFDTRLVRARSFAEGVLQTLAAEPFTSCWWRRGARPCATLPPPRSRRCWRRPPRP